MKNSFAAPLRAAPPFAFGFALALSLLSGAALAAAPAAPRADVLPFHATEKTLANGLRIIVVPTGFPDIVSVQIPVQTGSRNEVEPGKSGFAHFFEHMMFRGTAAYPEDKYQAVIAGIGARQNAFTTDDFTNFHTTFSKEDLETVLKLEADRFQHLSYSEAVFKTESRAVLGEYNKNSAAPMSKLFEAIRNAAFQQHTYKHTTMGFLKDIEDMPNQYEYSKVFFDRWYRPGNTTLIIAGDVDPAKTIALAEKYWSSWKPGSYRATIPAEPPQAQAVYTHVPWPTPTNPLVSVSFHGPAFSETARDFAALNTLFSLSFGPTSDLYKRLVEREQKVDQITVFAPGRVDPGLAIVSARVKKADDAVYVRDEILRTVARMRAAPVSERELADAKSSGKYALLRSLDNTDQIAATIAQFVRYRRSYSTINDYYRLVDSLTTADLQAAANKYLTDQNRVVATLSKDPLHEKIAELPTLAEFGPILQGPPVEALVLRSAVPQIRFKLLFAAGSADDPPGKEGLAELTAAMVGSAGSAELKIDEISKAFFPMAASFSEQVDKEMTTFTGTTHPDNWQAFTAIALPMILRPGFRDEDFRRLKDAQKHALQLDLKSNNEEEFGKERLQANIFAGTPYGHPVLGTVKGIEAITLDDVREFWRKAYAHGALRLAIGGPVTEPMIESLKRDLARLPPGAGIAPSAAIAGRQPTGIEVEILQKDTRATAISFGAPIAVTRSHPDFAALWVAKTYLGEHRESNGRLFKQIRNERGMNYGDYAYIEAFPRGMFQFFPDPNLGRRAQIFEIWVRPVAPENADMAFRLALHELAHMIDAGIAPADFEATRNYLLKNVVLMTATQNQQVGYALDAQWYKTPEFTRMLRDALNRMTVADVNAAIRRHLSAKNLSVVFITKDAEGLKAQLLADDAPAVKYDAPKSAAIMAEDRAVGSGSLGIRPEAIRITPADSVFAE